jgi:TolB-like protein
MKVIYINVLLIFLSINGFAQTSKVAILDFENTSGKTEYDALGKAMSSMLITDLSNNIHPKKVEFFERSQLTKLLDEQKLQKSKNFDAKTAVDFGKLSGVNYVFVGSVFVMDGNCNITSQLVDVQTSKIVLSKEANGKIEAWLQLKSQLAESIAQQLNNPISLDPSYKDQATTLASINQYGKVLSTMDQGDADKAEQMRSLFEETNPDFKYFADLKDDIDELKKQVAKNTADIEILNQSGGRVINAKTPREIVMNIANPLTTYNEASQMISQLLTNNIDIIKEAMWGRFETVWLPSCLPTSDLNIHLKDIEYLDSCLINKEGNPISISYYVFQHLRGYVKLFKEDKSLYAKHIEKIKILGNNLIEFNTKNKINSYKHEYFEMSTFSGSNSTVQILSPLESDKYARELNENDFNIKWVLSFIE